MSKSQSENEVRENIVNKLSWQLAERDEKRIAKEIHEGGEIDAVYGLDECGLLDGFYLFLEEAGVLGLLEKISAKSFRPNKINAVVVTKWDGKNNGRDNWVVYLRT